jgi:hypothetical protein
MLLNPLAVEKLKDITVYGWHPYTTHARRNELIRMFIEEAERLLDQKAESTIKHVVGLYSNGKISYEQYIELVEQVSEEEAKRGAAYGETYARNRVFDFAQQVLDRINEQAYDLALTDVKKQYEKEKQKADQIVKDFVQQYVTMLKTVTQQHDVELETLTQKQKEELTLNQESIIEHTKAEIEQVLARQLQEESERRERELHEQEELHPAREATRTAIERVALLEKKAQKHKQRRNGLVALGLVVFLALVISLLFFSFSQWITVIVLIVVAAIFVTFYAWKGSISDNMIAEHKRQVALFQTKSGEYAPLSEEDRCALLVQRVL